jgi:copper chaperone CopZ
MKKIIAIEGMTCGHCVARVEKALKSLTGATGVKVDLKRNQAQLDGGPASNDEIRNAVAEAGYTVVTITDTKAGFSLFRAG